jgi:hypothetical protein
VSIIHYKSSKLTDITADIISKLNASAPTTSGTASATPAAPAGTAQ